MKRQFHLLFKGRLNTNKNSLAKTIIKILILTSLFLPCPPFLRLQSPHLPGSSPPSPSSPPFPPSPPAPCGRPPGGSWCAWPASKFAPASVSLQAWRKTNKELWSLSHWSMPIAHPLIFKLQTEAYASTIGLLTDCLTHSLICPHMPLKTWQGCKIILWPNYYKVSGSKSPVQCSFWRQQHGSCLLEGRYEVKNHQPFYSDHWANIGRTSYQTREKKYSHKISSRG